MKDTPSLITPPTTAGDATTRPRVPPRFHSPYSPSILVLEDDVGLQTFFRRLVSKADPGAVVDWTTTSSEASLHLTKVLSGMERAPNLVLIDLLLPNVELGIHFWRSMRDRFPKMPVAFMSSVRPDTYFRMFQKGEEPPPFLRKPFQPIECMNLLKYLLWNDPTGRAQN